MLFTSSKYKKWYDALIMNAKTRIKPSEYTENHHVIPTSLGGSNDSSNIVTLTAREHFIAHRLLAKMTSGSDQHKMLHALSMLLHDKKNKRVMSSRTFALLKPSIVEAQRAAVQGTIRSAETRKKMSDAKIGRPVSAEARKAMSLAKLGTKQSEETKKERREQMLSFYASIDDDKKKELSSKISSGKQGKPNGHKGAKRSEETKEKMRLARIAYWAQRKAN